MCIRDSHVGVFAVIRRHLGVEAVDQEIKHVRFNRAVDHRQMLAVVQGVEHGDFQRGTQGDRRFARLQIHLHAVFFREGFQARAEGIDRIALAGEMDAAAEADPLDLCDQVAEALLDGCLLYTSRCV